MRFNIRDDAFTGLEAAIVLIAFVVVAAVFPYVVLGAGFFTTQKSQETVHTSVAQTSSSIEVVGDIYGKQSAPDVKKINLFRFDIGLTAGGSPVDLSKTVLTYSTSTGIEYLDFAAGVGDGPTAGTWKILDTNDADTDNLLERGEIITIQAKVTNGFGPNEQASLEIKPPVGAVLGLKRTAPPQIDAWNVLY